MKKAIFLLAMVFVCLAVPAHEYGVGEIPNVQVSDRTRLLSNPDGIVDSETEQRVNAMLTALRDSTGFEVAVVVVDDINGDDIDEFATDLFKKWGIGKKGSDNGVLFLVAKDRRKMTIRTGYGAEAVLPDIVCNRIIRDSVAPAFGDEDYSRGVLTGVRAISRFVSDPEEAQQMQQTIQEQEKKEAKNLRDAFFIVCGLLGAAGAGYAGHRRYRRYLRNKPRKCKKCGAQMVKQSEEKDNDYLTESRDFEERIGSVDYDVWVCPDCEEVEIESYPGKVKGYTQCPHCHTKAMKLEEEKTVYNPTRRSQGLARRYYRCRHCGHTKTQDIVLPMIAAASAASSFGGGGGGGGSIGGGFGGGLTGGGGASGGW